MADVLVARGHCAVALSGGTTPRPVYAALAAPDLAGRIDWNRVDVYFGDERAVPRDHPDSNFHMAMEVLLTRVAIPAARVHRMEGERRDLDAAAAAYDPSCPPRSTCSSSAWVRMGTRPRSSPAHPRSPSGSAVWSS